MKLYLITHALHNGKALTREGALQAKVLGPSLEAFDATYLENEVSEEMASLAGIERTEKLSPDFLHQSIQQGHKTISVIGDSATLRNIMRWILNTTEDAARSFAFTPSSVTLVASNSPWRLSFSDNTKHLDLLKKIL